jgi:hypothetical protein
VCKRCHSFTMKCAKYLYIEDLVNCLCRGVGMLGKVHMGNWEGMLRGKIRWDVGKSDYGKLGRYVRGKIDRDVGKRAYGKLGRYVGILGKVIMGNWEGMVRGKMDWDVGKRDYGKLGRYCTWEDGLGCWETCIWEIGKVWYLEKY